MKLIDPDSCHQCEPDMTLSDSETAW